VAAFDGFRRELPRLPTAFAADGYALLLDALGHLDDEAALARAEQEASACGALADAALEALSGHAARAGQLDRAIAYRLRQLEPDLPVGLQQIDGRGSWATRLALAGLCDRANQPDAALDHLDQAFGSLPANRRAEVSFHSLDYALRRDRLEAAVRWAPRAITCAPAVLDEQLKVLQLVIQLHARLPGLQFDSPWLELEQALAADDLQRIYDLGCQLEPRTYADLARLLTVIERVRAADEHQAALGLLNRALDGPKSETVYWLLIQTLTTLGRYQDAQLALEALRAFKRSLPESEQIAA
jgi:tetratricopeptide (TPR) repeat protein